MNLNEIEKLINGIPRKKLAFLPTPFHQLENISQEYGVDIYMKREDMTGPSTIGGNKIRKLEFIVGEALEKGVEYLISIGGYQSNSTMELVTAGNIAGLKSILYLGDVMDEGVPKEFKGNLLLSKILDCEINYILRNEDEKTSHVDLWNRMGKLAEERIEELANEGKKAMFIPSGCVHPAGFISYILTFKEIIEQSEKMGVKLDYIYHTTGTGGSLPALIAAKLMLKSDIKIVSIAINFYGEGLICSEEMICERVKKIYETLKLDPPTDEEIYKEINVDQSYVGVDYGVPTEAGSQATQILAKKEAILTDAIYTGKGFSGLLDHIKTGKIPKNSKVAFIHTGGIGSIFAEEHK